MDEKKKAIIRYTECNFLLVYGHQHQIQEAFSDGWDAAIKHLHSLPVREALRIIAESNKEKMK